MTARELLEKAFEAQKRAYCPYSHFGVGAALLTKSGKVYQACNVENAAFGVGVCAERNALYAAIYDGEREFEAIAVVGKKESDESFEICSPCGICRQALREFTDPETFQVIMGASQGEPKIYTLQELLPVSFGPENLS